VNNLEAQDDAFWGFNDSQFYLIARNVSAKYFAMGVEIAIGLLMLPFNVAYLGPSAYGLWILIASLTTYFSILDMGYGISLVKFAAEYRTRRDSQGLNQIVSTLFFVFVGIGLAAFSAAILLAFNLESLFNITPEQATTGRNVLLIISLYVATGFPFSVFGGIANGFQRNYLNVNFTILTSIGVAVVNFAVLLAGYGLVELVAATTAIRLLSYLGYRMNAYRAFPALEIRPKYFRLARLREVTGYSAYLLLIDLANRLNYATDTIVIGAFMSTAAIAIWTVAQRLIDITLRLTGQMNAALFPAIVDSDTGGRDDRLRFILLQGTRLSLAMVIPMVTAICLLARPLVDAWVGPKFAQSVPIIYILSGALIFRVGNSTATTLLKGAGRHRLLTIANVALGASNLGLSIALVRVLGLVGVALGTLIPLGIVSTLILFPAACRRVNIPMSQVLSAAVWPAVWPVSVMAVFLVTTRNFAGVGPVSVAVQAIMAGAIYVTIFLWLAIDRDERQWYLSKAKQLLRRPAVSNPAGIR
jgi:O-antigen/teichoic acid export membrane protein